VNSEISENLIQTSACIFHGYSYYGPSCKSVSTINAAYRECKPGIEWKVHKHRQQGLIKLILPRTIEMSIHKLCPQLLLSVVYDIQVLESSFCLKKSHGGRGRNEGFADLILSCGSGWRLVADFTP
jgi:hypothetical protein